jgi:hypothetical protein
LTAKAGGSFAHVVHLGDGLKGIRITRVAALPVAPGLKGEMGIDQVASWSDDGQGHVTAFLTRRSTGQLRLVVEGVLEIAPAGSMALPEIALVGADLARRTYVLERHSGVDLRVQGTAGLTPISDEPLSSGVTVKESGQSGRSSSGRPPEPPATGKSDRPSAEERPHGMARRFGAWLAGESASGVVSWQVNEPVVTATVATTIRPKMASRWDVQVAARLHVEQGVLDGIRIEVPPGWSEQVSISPAAPSHWESRSTGGRVLVIRPASPIAGEYSLEMSGEFPLGTDKRAPIVEIVGAAKQERWLILPTVWKAQRVLWKRRGLRESNLPTTFAPPAEPDARFAAYEILGVGSELFWESFTPAQSEPSVALADVWMGRQDAGQRIGAATFEVLPAGRSACVLQCPEGVRILQARIGDIPIRPVALDERNQRIDFGATFMPQTINVVFAVESAAGAASDRASAPRIRDWPVARTLWTTHDAQGPPAGVQTRYEVDSKARKSSGPCTALDQWRARREVLSQLWDVATQQSPTDASSWAPSWRRRLAVAKAHENGLVRPGDATPASPDEYAYVVIDPRTDRQQDFADQLAALAHEHQGIVLGQFDDATYCEVPRARQSEFREAVRSAIPSAAVRTVAAPPTSLGTTDFLARAGLGGAQVQHWHWDGSAFEMEFRPIEAAGSRGKGRWTAFFVLCAAIGGVVFARRQRWTALALGLPLSFPLAVGGLFWWLFLWPSWVGLVIIAAAVGSALRFPFLARP